MKAIIFFILFTVNAWASTDMSITISRANGWTHIHDAYSAQSVSFQSIEDIQKFIDSPNDSPSAENLRHVCKYLLNQDPTFSQELDHHPMVVGDIEVTE